MYILGVFGNFTRGGQDPSAALLKDGKIIAAAEEERFMRIKHPVAKMPIESINFCLKRANITIEEVDVVAFGASTWNDIKEKLKTLFKTRFGGLPKKIEYIDHHHAHAASAFFASGFKESMILTADWSGDGICTLLAHGHDDTIDFIKRDSGEQCSLGAYYCLITDYLGYQHDIDEYKVMGLAAYGKPVHDMSWLLDIKNNEVFLDTKYVNESVLNSPYPYQYGKQEPIYSMSIIEKLGPIRLKNEKISQRHMDIAASAQKQFEKIMKKLVELLHEHTKSHNLCLAGGVNLNSVCNGVLYSMDCVDKIFVPPVAGDNGIALGAALVVAVKNGEKIEPMEHAAYGPSFDNEHVEMVLKRAKCKYEKVTAIEKDVAYEISKGNLIGWFQGNMEFGPRALGNRSILGDPRQAEMKNKINQYVKFREDYRPLAPSVIEEDASNYFIDSCSSPFMTTTFNANAHAQKIIPAVVHVDGTSRIQTVNKKVNPLYHSLLDEFRKITDVSVLLNTSYNLSWEPIVMNPEQALATFSASGLDVLAIGDFLVKKNN